MDDDGTQVNRELRDGGTRRGSGQTHGAGDPSGVDAEPQIPQLRLHDDDDDAAADAAAPPATPSDARPS